MRKRPLYQPQTGQKAGAHLVLTRLVSGGLYYSQERCMPARSCCRLCAFAAAAIVALTPCMANADSRDVFVVIVPMMRPPTPVLRPIPPAQPELLWPIATGITPSPRSRAPRCYARTTDCPLEQPQKVGRECICRMSEGFETGFGLIPPSRNITVRCIHANYTTSPGQSVWPWAKVSRCRSLAVWRHLSQPG